MKPNPVPLSQAQQRRCPICKGGINVSIDDRFLPHFPQLNSRTVCRASNKTYREACDLSQK